MRRLQTAAMAANEQQQQQHHWQQPAGMGACILTRQRQRGMPQAALHCAVPPCNEHTHLEGGCCACQRINQVLPRITARAGQRQLTASHHNRLAETCVAGCQRHTEQGHKAGFSVASGNTEAEKCDKAKSLNCGTNQPTHTLGPSAQPKARFGHVIHATHPLALNSMLRRCMTWCLFRAQPGRHHTPACMHA